MRIPYIEPSETDFDRVFDTRKYIRGGGLQDIRVYNQQGGSLLGILSGVVGKALPFLRSFILPEIGNFAKNIAEDYGTNKISMKKTLKKNVITSGKNIAKKIMGG